MRSMRYFLYITKCFRFRRSVTGGFTLVELLLAIAIISILASATAFVLQPGEMRRRSRDGVRIAHMQEIQKSMQFLLAEKSTVSLGSANTVYISLPDSASDCSNLGLPDLQPGWTYNCVSEANLYNIDGTGWIPVDFTRGNSALFSVLPVDPVNESSTSRYYTYTVSSSWAAASLLESSKHLQEEAATDGGV